MTSSPRSRAAEVSLGAPQDGASPSPARLALKATALTKRFPLQRNAFGRASSFVNAVDGIDLSVVKGTTVGVVGESGSGKTTLGRLISRLLDADDGTIEVNGVDVTRVRGRDLQSFREAVQVIFQNPFGALDPTKTIGHAVAEPLLVHKHVNRAGMEDAAARLLEDVALDPGLVGRYPEELSGGQRQRVCIARALALGPEILVADEPTSALDLSTRSEILNLLLSLQETKGQSIVLISHDFATVRHLAHRIVVMYKGRIVEEGPTAEVVGDPQHPYTQALLSAVPVPEPGGREKSQRIALRPDTTDQSADGHGCNFRNRCPLATETCASVDPPLVVHGKDRRVACVLHA